MTPSRPHLADRERKRLFILHNRTCHICGLGIDALSDRWEIEHIVPRSLIGTRADTDDNMKPAHVLCHKGKTAKEAGERAEAIRRESHHQGAHRSKTPLPCGRSSGRKKRMDGSVVDRWSVPASAKTFPVRRSIYTPESF